MSRRLTPKTQALLQPSFIRADRPARQSDFRRIRFSGAFGDFEVCLYLILGSLREPVPFSFGFALRPLAAIGFQFSQSGNVFHRSNTVGNHKRSLPHRQANAEIPKPMTNTTLDYDEYGQL